MRSFERKAATSQPPAVAEKPRAATLPQGHQFLTLVPAVHSQAAASDRAAYFQPPPPAAPDRNGSLFIQRKCCAACDDERPKIHAKSDTAVAPVAASRPPDLAREVISGGGRPLDAGTQSFFGARLNHDFTSVRVHDDARAGESARAMNALAYTVGNHVVFGRGAFAPSTSQGRRLLAHELTHVVQQSGGADMAMARADAGWSGFAVSHPRDPLEREADHVADQIGGETVTSPVLPHLRAPKPLLSRVPTAGDLQIDGLAGTPASRLASVDRVFFDRASAVIVGPELTKITTAATGIAARWNASPHRVRGYSSEEEPASLALTRATAVATAMGAPTGARQTDALPGASAGQQDYREWRHVDVEAPAAPPATTSCAGVAPTHACAGTEESTFRTARSQAEADVRATQAALTTPNATTRGLLDRFFGAGVPGAGVAAVADVRTNINKILTHVFRIQAPRAHICAHSRCNPDCQEAGAQTVGLGLGAPAVGGTGGIEVTICPSFFSGAATPKWRRNTIVHESSHGTAGMVRLGVAQTRGTDDYAYESERLFPVLPTAQALGNADTFALFVESVARGAVGPTTPFTDVPDPTFTATELPQVRLAVGRAEKWTTWAQQNVASLFATMPIAAARLSWTHPSVPGYGKPLMDLVSPPAPAPLSRFRLTPTSTGPPTVADRAGVAAIEDRLLTLQQTFRRVLTMTRTLANPATVWSGGPPRSTVTIGADFFALAANSNAQALLLLRKLLEVTAGVSPGVVGDYVSLIDDIQRVFHP